MVDKITLTISRRKFAELLMGLVVLFQLVGIGTVILKYLWPKTVSGNTGTAVKIATVDEIKVGDAKKFMFNGKASVVLKTPAGFRAFGAVCTHLGCIAYWKLDENIIFCPCHLGKFDPNTGAVLSGPPPSPIPAIDIEVKGGEIFALKWKDPDYVKSISFYAGAV